MQLDNGVIAWKSGLSQLVSLLDMLKICAEEFCSFIHGFDELFRHGFFDSSRSKFSAAEEEQITKVINQASNLCKLLELEAALKIISHLIMKYCFGWWEDGLTSPDVLSSDMWMLRCIIDDGLSERFFKYIPKDEAEWYEKEDSFGVEVSTAFPSAKDDIKEAGTCYATGRYTACVFHLMRVLEHGLRALAKDVELACGKKTWGSIIGKIKKIIGDLNPQTDSEIERSQFLSEAATEFRYFKDAWRNHVTHSRYHCKEKEEAWLIFNHVKSFMNHLSKKLGE